MMHPDTRLGPVNPVVGLGVFATAPIPRGTVVWVRDPLDTVLTRAEADALFTPMRERVYHYAYVTPEQEVVLCWDHARYMNHACSPNTRSAGDEFDVAVEDIPAGAEITCDYGAFGSLVAFVCRCGAPACRRTVRGDDLARLGDGWRALAQAALREGRGHPQPIAHLIRAYESDQRLLERSWATGGA